MAMYCVSKSQEDGSFNEPNPPGPSTPFYSTIIVLGAEVDVGVGWVIQGPVVCVASIGMV